MKLSDCLLLGVIMVFGIVVFLFVKVRLVSVCVFYSVIKIIFWSLKDLLFCFINLLIYY